MGRQHKLNCFPLHLPQVWFGDRFDDGFIPPKKAHTKNGKKDNNLLTCTRQSLGCLHSTCQGGLGRSLSHRRSQPSHCHHCRWKMLLQLTSAQRDISTSQQDIVCMHVHDHYSCPASTSHLTSTCDALTAAPMAKSRATYSD